MQYRIEHVNGWKNPAIIRVKDGVIIGHIYVGHEDELKPYLGQGVDVERLGLSTEEIESGNVETKLKTAHDMLEALEEVMGELDVEGLPCPLCGGSAASGHKYNCLWHVVNAAIRKARGGESPMTRETEAVELLHRVLNYFVGEFAFPEKMERLLEEIEVFLTDLEAEERDALRK